MEKIEKLIRFGVPGKMDQWPQHTRIHVVKGGHEDYDLYIQMSENEESPVWELIGTFDQQEED